MNASESKAKILERVRSFFFHRSRAYKMVFKADSPFTEEVLADLSKFCRADETTFHADPRIHAALEGRREVYLRIIRHLRLSPEQLMKIYAAKEAQ